MNRIDDAKLCLSASNDMLREIEIEYYKHKFEDTLPPILKVKIKNFLENVRSSLEYATNYIFFTYCSKNYNDKELKKKKIYFPIRKDKPFFDKCVNRDFKGLYDKEDILTLFEQCQYFNGVNWAQNLAALSNENKHINLTKQSRKECIDIKHLSIGGLNMTNCYIEGFNSSIVIDNTPLTSKNISNNPYIRYFDGNFTVEFLFKDINEPVIPTLKDIYNGANLFIENLELTLKATY